MQTRNATEILEMFHFMRSIRSIPPMTSFNMEIFKSDKLLFPLLQNIPFSPCKLRNATEILEMFHFMRSIRSTPPMTSFNMEIFKSTNFFSHSWKHTIFTMQTRNATEILEMFHFMRSIRSTPPMTSFNMEIFKSDKLLFPLLQNIPFSPCKLRNATEILEMFHFMRSIRSTPPMTSFNMEIFKSDKLLFPLLQNIPFSPCKLGMRQKSSKCSISCVRSVVLLQWHRSTWKSSNLTNFFSHSCKTYHFHHAN